MKHSTEIKGGIKLPSYKERNSDVIFFCQLASVYVQACQSAHETLNYEGLYYTDQGWETWEEAKVWKD